MKEVKFVRATSEMCGYSLGKGSKYSFNTVENTIREYMQDGWEYNGFAPLTTRGTGDMETITLIFQREV